MRDLTHFRSPGGACRQRPGLIRLLASLLLIWGVAGSPPALAINQVVIEVGELILPQVHAGGITAVLDLTPRSGPSARMQADVVDLPAPIGQLRELALICSSVT